MERSDQTNIRRGEARVRQQPAGSRSEIRGTRADGLGRVTRGWLLSLGAGAGLCLGGPAAAGPIGEQVVYGEATVSRTDDRALIETTNPDPRIQHRTLVETATPRTVIRWQDFDIATDEAVHFQQPSTGSRVLNRVSDAKVTTIAGELTSNGQVWVVNPAGVYFENTALVEVEKLVAAASNVSTASFVLGTSGRFDNVQGEVRNRGTIRADDVTLVGRRVVNNGQIVVDGGSVVMAAGDDVWVARRDSNIRVEIAAVTGSPDVPAVENTGSIETGGGRALLAAGDLLGLAIQTTGEIRARDIALEAGDGGLVAVSGRLDASDETPGATGGTIDVRGDWILLDGAVLDASGTSGGGTIHVGGEAHGAGDGRNARVAVVDDDTIVRADALSNGDGGEIVVWSEEDATVLGTLSANGGAASGDGGFIETSSKGRVDIDADVSVSAPSGAGANGEWLIDPVNVDVVEEILPGDVELEALVQGRFFHPPEQPVDPNGDPVASKITAETIVQALRQGADIIVSTTTLDSDAPGEQEGDITVDAAIVVPASSPTFKVEPDSTSTLTFAAANDITINQRIATENEDLTLNLSLVSNDLVQPELDDAQQNVGTVTIAADLALGGGNLRADGIDVTVGAGVTIETQGGDVDFVILPKTDDLLEDGKLTLEGVIRTDGGAFRSEGGAFHSTADAVVDLTAVTDPPTDEDATGPVFEAFHDGAMQVEGHFTAGTIQLSAGEAGEGDLTLGNPLAAPASTVLEADSIRLEAGEGQAALGDPDRGTARIAIDDASVQLRNAAGDAAPERFEYVQDARIVDADLPGPAQFGGPIEGMVYVVETRAGGARDADVGGEPDVVLSTPEKFADTRLAVVAPDSFETTAVLAPRAAEVTIFEGFTVTQELADDLKPTESLFLHAGLNGQAGDDLDFGPDVVLEAPEITLRAGDPDLLRSATEGFRSVVNVNPESGDGPRLVADRVTIRQDGDIAAANIPRADQYGPAPGTGPSGLELAFVSEGGSITLEDPAVVADSSLTLLAIGLDANGSPAPSLFLPTKPAADPEDPDVPDPLHLRSIDIGQESDFTLTEHLAASIVLEPNGTDDAVFTARSNTGTLAFQSTDADGNDLQVPITADTIQLIGSSVDLTGAPLLQRIPDGGGAPVSPKRLVVASGNPLQNGNVPGAASYPDGLGPSELMVLQSATSINLLQTRLRTRNEQHDRNWDFPIGDDADLILTAPGSPDRPGVDVSRTDGFDVVLTARDHLFSDNVVLEARLTDADARDPLNGDARVFAPDVGSIRAFGGTQDWTVQGATVDDFLPDEAIGFFDVVQDEDILPDDGFLPNAAFAGGFQPGTYGLQSSRGSIEVDATRFLDTNLVLNVETEGESIDFPDFPEVLSVHSLNALVAGDWRVPDGTTIVTNAPEEDLSFVVLGAGSASLGNLTFGDDVVIETHGLSLLANNSFLGRVEARGDGATAPTFRNVATFGIFQGGVAKNGVPAAPEEGGYSLLPEESQFVNDAAHPLESYTLAASGGIEIQDPGAVFIAAETNLFAGTDGAPREITLRALAETGDPNLVLIDPASFAPAAVRLDASSIRLEAPDGYVDAGDPRIAFTVSPTTGSFAIRQKLPIDDGTRIPDLAQFTFGLGSIPYVLQSLTEITVDAAAAERTTGSSLVLIAGVSEPEFESSIGAVRDAGPVEIGDFPDNPERAGNTYDFFADVNRDDVVDEADQAAAALLGAKVAIGAEGEVVDLTLQQLAIVSVPNDGVPIELFGATITTEADQVYDDEILLRGDRDPNATPDDPSDDIPTELVARAGTLTVLDFDTTPPTSNITFREEIDGEGAGAQALVVTASDRVTFLGDIGANTPLGGLRVNLESILQIDEIPPTPTVQFGSLTEAADFGVYAATIELNPDAGDQSSVFFRQRTPNTATFFHTGGDLTFDTGAGGTFVMGTSEKLTTNGGVLTINTSGPDPMAPYTGTATIGDLSALEKIEVTAGDIHIRRRDRGSLIRANGRGADDRGVDFVANDIQFRFNRDAGKTLSETLFDDQIGGGKTARFGIADPLHAPEFMDEFPVLALRYNLLAGVPGTSTVFIDGVPDGLSRSDLSRAFENAVPRPSIAVPASYLVPDRDALQALGIATRDPEPVELQRIARGAGIFDDMASLPVAGSTQVTVSEHRLIASEVERAEALYDRVFGEDGSRSPEIRAALQGAVDDYRRSTGARRIVGFELRRYIYNRPSSQFKAYQELQGLDALFRHHRRSGLTPAEYSSIQRAWLESVQPEGLDLRELFELVHPSHYVRGSDVLDVFGE